MQWRLKRLRIGSTQMREGVVPAGSGPIHTDDFASWLAAYRGRLDQLRNGATRTGPAKDNHYASCIDHEDS
jgi:hypothetical protein